MQGSLCPSGGSELTPLFKCWVRRGCTELQSGGGGSPAPGPTGGPCQRVFSARSECPQPGLGLWGSRHRERRVRARGKPGSPWFRQPPTESSGERFARLQPREQCVGWAGDTGH